MEYVLYVRKSSESDDRQALSIESQIDTLTLLAVRKGLTIKQCFKESKSAKEPGRPVFNQMMETIERGGGMGILCWKLDRLSRNPIDEGRLRYLLAKGIIDRIMTPERDYLQEDNVLVQAVEYGMANQYIRDLSKNVRRGMNTKLQHGWLPSRPPIGYINDPISKTIIPDEHNFPLIRQLLEKAATGAYNATRLWELADELGVRAHLRGKLTARRLSVSHVYNILPHPFYAGIIKTQKGEEVQGSHVPMITVEQHKKLVSLFGKAKERDPTIETPKNAERKRHHPLAGLIHCACGRMLTPWKSRNRAKNGKDYLYFVCTRRFHSSNGTICREPFIRADRLESQLKDHLTHIQLPKPFADWLKSNAHLAEEAQKRKLEEQLAATKTQIKVLETKQKRLIDLALDTGLDGKMFEEKKTELNDGLSTLRENQRALESQLKSWQKNVDQILDIAESIVKKYEHGTDDEVKQIIKTVFARLTLWSGKLERTVRRPFGLLEELSGKFEAKKTDANTIGKIINTALCNDLINETPVKIEA